MSLQSERFPEGLTYEEFKQRMTQNRERIESNERDIEVDAAEVEAFRLLPEPLHVLAIAEDWCRDAVDNLPIVARLAAESGKLDLRIFPRDENQELMNLYLKEGKYQSLPVFAFFDSDFHELGRFIERPDSVTELRERRRAELLASQPDLTKEELNETIRQETRPMANREVVRELRAIAERTRIRN